MLSHLCYTPLRRFNFLAAMVSRNPLHLIRNRRFFCSRVKTRTISCAGDTLERAATGMPRSKTLGAGAARHSSDRQGRILPPLGRFTGRRHRRESLTFARAATGLRGGGAEAINRGGIR
jgi:hypothetical protein